MLFIGLSDYGYGCHKDFPHGQDHDCDGPRGGGGGDKIVGEYLVEIDDTLTGLPWSGHANESRIDGNPIPGLLGRLGFFRDRFSVADFANCFESRNGGLVGFGGVQRKPGDTAYGQFWFPGCTKAGGNGGVCDQEVLYQLQTFGTFGPTDHVDCFGDCSVIPLAPGDFARMVMTDWILQISNGGLNIQTQSCLAESDSVVPPFAPPVVILVERLVP